jgi:hypothetical protein
MGLIIWQLATLSRVPPSATRPFVPSFPVNGKRAAGVCYGIDIMVYPFSERLKQTILSCLYEDPRLRPEILDLKMRIRDGVTSCMLQGMPMDPFTTFLP